MESAIIRMNKTQLENIESLVKEWKQKAFNHEECDPGFRYQVDARQAIHHIERLLEAVKNG